LAAGEVNVEQAQAVVETLQALPGEVKPEVADQVEAAMLEHADVLDPAQLRAVGTRALAHVAPEVAEEADRKAMEAAEARAVQKRGLHLSPDEAGGVTVRGSLDPESAAIVRAALDPLTKPNRADDGGLDGRSAPQRRADALAEICRRVLGTDTLPTTGGDPVQLVVTTGFDPLTRQLGAGMLPRHRPAAQPRDGAPVGLRRDHPPRRPGRAEPGPRPRPAEKAVHRRRPTRAQHSRWRVCVPRL
jgi:hypothetical protein